MLLKIFCILTEFGILKDIDIVEVVIIGHNEARYAEAMKAGIPHEWKVTYIADRCTRDELGWIRCFFPDAIDTSYMALTGRQTSFCRNLGLSKCDPSSDVLFLDGDRHPVEGSLTDMYENIRTDAVCLPIEEDFRTVENFETNYGRVYNGFFSCGLFMKRSAIEKVREFQNGQLFREDMQDVWGIEDTTLGDVCYSLGLTAELSGRVKLCGSFDRNHVDSLDVVERRLTFRNSLPNVRWD